MRRNGDERLRELERRVIAGDLGAVLQLHQERKRAGQTREHYTQATFLREGRGPDQIALAFMPGGVDQVRVQFGQAADIGTGSYYSRPKINLPPFVVRGVPHRGDIWFTKYSDAEGFVALGPIKPNQTYREDASRYVLRADQFHTKASDAARAVIVRTLTPIVNEWVANHPRAMLEASVGNASNEVLSTDKDVAKAIEALEAAQQKLADALSREVRFEDELRRTPPDVAPNPGSVTFWHGTLRSRLNRVLGSGINVSSGWGGAGTSGVYLSGSPDRALYWAKMAWQLAHDEKMEEARFDRKYGDRVDEILALVQVTIPEEALGNLRADMEQAEDVGFEGEPEDWEASLEEIGDVMYDGPVPGAWLREVEVPAFKARDEGEE